MDRRNNKIMQIDKEILNEKNYEGTKLIEITDEQIIELNEKRKELLKEGEPFLKDMEKLSPPLDAWYAKLRPVEEEREKIKKDMQPAYDAYNEVWQKMDKVYEKGQLVANKIQPLVTAFMKDKLSEFETSKQMIEKDGKLFVEVVDEIEEKIKAIRASKKNDSSK